MVATANVQARLGMGHPLWVGETPLLPLRRVDPGLPSSVRVFCKAEWLNPSGSVKDRSAWYIVREALQAGELSGGKALLDSTSGNMGIAYATLGAALGFRVRLVIPGSVSHERISILGALGAELLVSSPLEGSDGAQQLAVQEFDREPGRFFYANQYNNPANWKAHFETTGPEIWEETRGSVTHLIAGLGTTGTLMGAGRFLRRQNPKIYLGAVQPASPFHGLEGLKHLATSHLPGIYDPGLQDEVLEVETEEAYAMVRLLAREEGLFVGVSSGAAALAALRIARRLSRGSIVAIFPDSGHKYLSQEFWGQA
ncbi:MAG: cysteine synthase family protein [Anaerolineales bacterium]